MNRRTFLRHAAGLTAFAGVFSSLSAHAAWQCTPFNAQGIQQCDAGILSNIATVSINSAQNKSQWCWAACIQMVFGYYGHPISQTRIVEETFGQIVNMPAQSGQILSALNRQWIDDNGNTFTSSGNAFGANHVTAAQYLADNKPLIIGTQGHAVVLTAVRYLRDQYGKGRIIDAIVRDPWPGRGKRGLTPQEWYGVSFASLIDVY